jgi:glycosyltransferase involved in cell wall biosynthesis
MKILHITAHLGGGVGKALSGLVEQAKLIYPNTEHIIACLEKQEKRHIINEIQQFNIKVIECPTIDELRNLMKKSDIVQLEYWNHPILFRYLCEMEWEIPSIRLITWSYNNGLYNPIIPENLIINSYKFIFTSECSYQNSNILDLINKKDLNKKFDVIYCVGNLPNENINNYKELSFGYVGTLNFSKLHPNFADYINSVKISNFKVDMIGDILNKDILEKQTNKLNFKGFIPNIINELKNINVLIYLLNPYHYGTTENILLESMSIGIIPIVLNNPCEACIVTNNKTGFIVNSISEFSDIINYINKNPNIRKIIGNNASEYIKEKYNIKNTEDKFNKIYNEIMLKEKTIIDFKSIFGDTPDKWFLSCQNNKEIFNKKNGTINLNNIDKYYKYSLFEQTKGSIFHFSNTFPDNGKLKTWANNMKFVKENK